MRASIVIPNWNGEKWLEASVRSCLAQRAGFPYEVLVIDNGSTDASRDIVRRMAREDDRLKLFMAPVNRGFSAAVNGGIRRAKGEYVVLFNNDAFAEPEWLAELVETADTDPNIFSVGSLMLRHADPALADDAGDYMTILGWACKRGDGLSRRRYTKPERIFSACGGAALYRKSLFEKVGYFDERFFAYLEDVDIGWRANALGYKNVFCPTAVCLHIASATTGSKYNDFKAKQGGRNNILLSYKNMPFLQYALNAPFLLTGDLIKILFFHIRGYGKPYMEGHKEALALLPKMKKPRFQMKNLPHYLYIQKGLITGMFRYADYRVRRALGLK